MTKQAIYVELKAKSGKEEEVATFLRNAQALVEQEPGTVTWFALRYDRSTFAIFDAFDDEAGRQAHLNGKVAAALTARAEELLSEAPELRTPQVLADKVPG